MSGTGTGFVVAAVIVCLGGAARLEAGQGSAGSAGNAAAGKTAFIKAGCPACHGTMGQGGPGGRLAPKPVPTAAFTTIVRRGRLSDPRGNRNWAGMPPFSTKFISDPVLADIYAYLASIPEPPAVSSNPLLTGP